MSDTQWLEWGRKNPYYGVYSEDRFHTSNIEATKGEFFATGEANVSWMLGRAEQYFGPLGKGRVLEFGAGVARMSIPLASRFETVIGVELSPDMRAEAVKNCQLYNVKNVEIVPSDDDLSHASGEFDLVLSYIVLQHVDARRGVMLIDKLLSKVGPNGVAILQASVKRPERRLSDRLRYHLRHNVPVLAATYRFLRGKGWNTLSMRMSEYDPIAILAAFSRNGMKDVLLSEHYQGDVLTFHFTARKGG
ncbi:methylase of polypeptide subunit release factors [Agrobacterium pusense]|uniref:class I SAM-dependent methyltransferase n=1 Tax=Agrobacterium pusense TaxID=648995 RepID=UPI0005EE50E0|nr:class I SAM-dependent methyltransferase [Agrobacterium pusense]MDR6190739.1 methylase of polypeptide subunit release factors [Agrobacterium pusense]